MTFKNSIRLSELPFITRRFGVDTKEVEKYMHIHEPQKNGPGHEYSHEHKPEHEHAHEQSYKHDHEHEHKQTDHKAGGVKAGYGLVVIIGLTPCVALLPIVFAVTTLGTFSVVTIMAVFFVATLGTILLTTMLTLKGFQLVRLEFFEKHGEVITGLVIALTGILVVGLGL